MAERTRGLYRLVGIPKVYAAFQDILGARAGRRRLVTEFIQPSTGDAVLDLGCGSAAILADLPDDVCYTGVDHNPRHIDKARATFGDRGIFAAGNFAEAAKLGDRKYDIILALGLLHHLDDSEMDSILRLAQSALAPNGRFLTIDPVFESGQSPVANFLIRNDSGRNVRTAEGYIGLSRRVFGNVSHEVRSDLLRVPYTHCLIVHRL